MHTIIGDFFTFEEVDRLEAGLPRLQEWSDSMLISFQAQQLRFASILWINSRWFMERGININDDSARQRVSNWLLGEFGYAIPLQGDPKEAFAEQVKTLYADRYGGSTGRSRHGGSGRVATAGCYQAKGIGITPLAGAGSEWAHSHGCASLEESVREAIFAEVAAAEFPFGAVPVIAILDTGLYFSELTAASADSQKMRRAIIVRPAVLRPAHAERAPLFLRSLIGCANSQSADVQRTKDVIHRWVTQDTRQPQSEDFSVPTLKDLVQRIAEQIAFGQVHRLFNGGYFSSNLSVTGALLDFGGMRALPHWGNARNLDRVVGFGDEMKILSKVIQSLTFYFNKYQPKSARAFQEAVLQSLSKEAYTRTFTKECLRIWSMDTTNDVVQATAIVQSIRRYFSHQQRLQVNYKHGLVKTQDWLYEVVADLGGSTKKVSTYELKTIVEIQCIIGEHFSKSPECTRLCIQAWSTAVRHLMPRDAINREALQQKILSALSANRQILTPYPRVIRELIHQASGEGRRHWPRLSRDLVVYAHVAYGGFSALLCRNLATEQSMVWLEGIRMQNEYWLFDSSFTSAEADFNVECDGLYWTAQVPISQEDIPLSHHRIKLKERSIEIPLMQVRYAQLQSWLIENCGQKTIAASG